MLQSLPKQFPAQINRENVLENREFHADNSEFLLQVRFDSFPPSKIVGAGGQMFVLGRLG
jgi:hypothetical protein